MTGAEIAAWRDRHDWTQQQLADALGVNRVSVARWERDLSGVKVKASKILERALRDIEREMGKPAP